MRGRCRTDGHTQVSPGARVLVKLTDGTIVIDRFLDRGPRYIVLESLGRIRRGRVCSIRVFKGGLTLL